MDVPNTTVPPHRDNMSTSGIKREVLGSDSDLQVYTEASGPTVCDVVPITPEPSLAMTTEAFPISTDNIMEVVGPHGIMSDETHKYLDHVDYVKCVADEYEIKTPIHKVLVKQYMQQTKYSDCLDNDTHDTGRLQREPPIVSINGSLPIAGSRCRNKKMICHMTMFQDGSCSDNQTDASEFISSTNIKTDGSEFMSSTEPFSNVAEYNYCNGDTISQYHIEAAIKDNDNVKDGVDIPNTYKADTEIRTHELPVDGKQEDSAQHTDYNSSDCKQLVTSEPISPGQHVGTAATCDVLMCVDRLIAEDENDKICPYVVKMEDQVINRFVEQDTICLSDPTAITETNCRKDSQPTWQYVDSNAATPKRANTSYTQTDKSLTCTICNKNLASSSYLRRHMLTHSVEKAHACIVCDKRFRLVSHLKLHMVDHSSEKPHCCELCGMRFKKPRCLKVHMVVHSKETPHCCELCKKCFKRAVSLKRHMITHYNETLHSCSLCDRNFTSASYLKLHMLTHPGVKPQW